MHITKIDMDQYPRKEHFNYFRNMSNPYVGVTANVDITALMTSVRKQHAPFFLSLLHAVSQAANRVPELRQRIKGDDIFEYDWCDTSHTVALPNGAYGYCNLHSQMPYEAFIPYAIERQQLAIGQPSLDDGEDPTSLIFISCLPWLSYASITQPTPVPADSNPRITWGKYFTDGAQTLIPMTLLANHALVDGQHLARFYEALDEVLHTSPFSI